VKNGGIILKIYIENQILGFENNKNEIDKILGEIDNIMDKSCKILSHIIIDDFEIYEDYYDYFLDNIRVIEKVEVISSTYKELVEEILISTIDYIKRVPLKVEELANNFYKNPSIQDWNDLNDLLGGISWTMNTFVSIDQDSRLKDVVLSYENWNLYAKEVFALQEILPDFEGALSVGDNITIADILSYELIPIFIKMVEELLELVNLEGSLDGLN